MTAPERDAPAGRSGTDDPIATRVAELEAQLMFQEHTIGALNDALVAQQSRIDALERALTLLEERLHRIPERREDPAAPRDEPPPHY